MLILIMDKLETKRMIMALTDQYCQAVSNYNKVNKVIELGRLQSSVMTRSNKAWKNPQEKKNAKIPPTFPDCWLTGCVQKSF